MNKQEFVRAFRENFDHFAQFNKLKSIVSIELGARPDNGLEEKAIMQNILGGSLDWQNLILVNMKKDDVVYIINKVFWDQW